MFSSAAAVACSSFFGFELVSSFLYDHFDVIFRAGVGSCLGIILSAWTFFIISLKIPLSFAHGLVHTIILFILAVIIHLIRYKKQQKNANQKLLKPITYIVAVIIPFVIVSFFVKTGLLQKGYLTKGSAYGDFPFHMNLISSFVHGCNKNRKSLFDIKSPFFANEKLAYPFIPNYYSAVLISCFDASIHDSTVIPSFVFIAALFIVMANISYQFSNSEVVCCIAPYLFLFTGGLGFTQWFDKKIRKEFFVDYVYHWGGERTEYWFQTIVHILLPQRASLFSMPLAWSVIAILMKCNNGMNIKAFLCAGLIVASLAQVQTHSIIALLEWGVVYAAITFPYTNTKKWKSPILNYLSLGLVAIIIGLPQCLPYFGRTQKDFFKIAPISQEIPGRNIFTLWWYGLGAFIVIALIHVPLVISKKQLIYYAPSLAVFLLSNIIWYQPWGLDNTKVFNAAFIPLASIGIATFLTKLHLFGKYGDTIATLLFVYCTVSGMLACFAIGKNSYPVWDRREQPYEIARFVIQHTPPDAVWITDSGHTNPVITLAGRQTLVGYKGWLISHNLDDGPRSRTIQRLTWRPDYTDEVDKYNVSYIGIRKGVDEVKFSPNLKLGNWKIVYQSSQFTAYKRTKTTGVK